MADELIGTLRQLGGRADSDTLVRVTRTAIVRKKGRTWERPTHIDVTLERLIESQQIKVGNGGMLRLAEDTGGQRRGVADGAVTGVTFYSMDWTGVPYMDGRRRATE